MRNGFFEAVYLTPHATSWSRLRSSTTQGQLPLRSRSEPLGLSSLNPQQTEKVRQSNREMEAVSWFAAQSARCTVRRVSMVLTFLEDFGGHVRDGPASSWSSREFQDLERACDVRRGPVGILTNLPTLQSRLSTLAHPGKMWRRIILSRPTSSIMSMRSSACSVQGNGRTGALLIF